MVVEAVDTVVARAEESEAGVVASTAVGSEEDVVDIKVSCEFHRIFLFDSVLEIDYLDGSAVFCWNKHTAIRESYLNVIASDLSPHKYFLTIALVSSEKQ